MTEKRGRSNRAKAHAAVKDTGGVMDFLSGGGEMGKRIRAFDWRKTPLGPPENWPQSLRSALSMLLPSKAQIVFFWGRDLITFYNDAYRPVFGAKHPRVLGLPAREAWSELWFAGLKELFEGVLTTGEAYWASDRPFYIERFGYPEETFFDVSYDPVRDETGRVGGVFCIVNETTERVISARRLKTLRELGVRTMAEAKSAEHACQSAAQILAANRYDLPFSLIYLLDGDGKLARLAGMAGLQENLPAAIQCVDMTESVGATWPFREVMETGHAEVVADLPWRLGAPPSGVWPEPPQTAVVLPIGQSGQDRPAGFLVAGVNPRRPLDDQHRGFFDLLANQLGTAIADARTYEEERKRAEALAEIDRAKTVFFSNVSHEFRTPLTLMLGPVQDFLSSPQNEVGAKNRELLNMVQRNGLRLQKLVNTLLDFSRIEAGRIQTVYEPTDLAALTAELASSFRSACEKAGLALSVRCDTLAESIYVDREMWEKIVLNLISNAFKYTLAGEIEVSLRESDEWSVASGETGGADGGAELSRAQSVAGSDELSGRVLSRDKDVSEGGTVRPDKSDSPSGSIDSSEHRGRTGEKFHEGVPQSSQHRARVAAGVGDSPATQSAGGPAHSGDAESAADAGRRGQSNAFGASSRADGEKSGEWRVGSAEWEVASGESSLVTQRSPLTTHHSPQTPRSVVLTVRDTGIGISEYEISNIFKRFYRIEAARGRTHEGTGIGLSLVQELVKFHGGNIGVQSVYGEGSTFTVRIPLGNAHLPADRIRATAPRALASTAIGANAYVEEAIRWLPGEEDKETEYETGRQGELKTSDFLISPSPTLPVSPSASHPRIIVADDNADMRDYLRRLLAQQNYRVESVADGQAALAAARREKPGLMIIDVMMPIMDGFALLRAVREDEELKTIPVIMLSARAGEEAKVEGLNAGADDYLIKPFSARELLAHVGAHLAMDRVRKEAAEKILLSEAELRDFVENANVGLHRVGSDGIILWANQTELDLLGYTREEYVGHSIADFHVDVAMIEDILARLSRGERVVNCETAMRCKDGSIRHVLINSSALFEDGKFIHTRCFTRDITERKRAEQADARLGSIVDSSDDAIISEDLNGVITSWNHGAEQIFGYKAPEAIGQPVSMLIPPERLDEEPKILERIRRGERIEHYETVRRRKDGRLLNISLSVSPLRDANGRIVGASKIARDITDRKEAEKALVRLAAIVESSDDAIISEDLIGVITSWNYGAERLFGYTAEEAVGKPVSILIPAERLDEEPVILERIRRGERIEPYETVRRRKDGALLNISLSVSPIIDGDGRVVGASKIARDITQRKLADEKLRQSEQRFRMMADSSPVMIWITNAKGETSFLNRNYLEYSGVRADEAPTFDWSEITHPEDRDAYREAFKAALRERRMFHHRVRLRRHDGQWRWFESRGNPILDDAGNMIAFIGSASDITEIYESQQALKELGQRKDEFLANMSHEIRSPLTGIMGYADILLSKLKDPEDIEYLSTIKESGNYLIEIVSDILDLAKIEAGKLVLNIEEVSVHAVLVEVQSLMDVRAKQKRLPVVLRYEGVLPVTIQTDRTRLRQILINLVSNSIKFTERGRVEIVARFLEDDSLPTKRGTRASQPGGHRQTGTSAFQVEVIDTGIGIEPEHQEILFQPFTQADSRSTREYGGTGLGLTITKRLVEMLGGHISFESALGQGSTFRITVPTGTVGPIKANKSEPLDAAASKPIDSPLRDHRVLVVDDREEICYLVSRYVKDAGAQPTAVSSGPAAIEAIQAAQETEPFDAMILDIQMPNMDGFDVARTLRAKGFRTPIIALTAAAMVGDREKCLEAGCDDYLTKPIDRNALVRLIAQHVHKANGAATPGKLRVLLVDDSHNACKFLTLFLEKRGYEVRSAYDGESAIAAAQDFRPGVILVDIRLPDMDGFQLLKQFKELDCVRGSRFIGLSGYRDRENQRVKEFDHFLEKPLDTAHLETLLRAIAD